MPGELVAAVVFVGATCSLLVLAGYWIYFNTHRSVRRTRATGRGSMPYYTRVDDPFDVSASSTRRASPTAQAGILPGADRVP